MTADAATPEAGVWRAVLAAMGRPAWLVDGATQRVWMVNGDAQALLGRPAEALVGAQAISLSGSPEDLAYWDEVRGGSAQALCSDTLLCDAAGGCIPVTRRIRRIGSPGEVGHYLVSIDDRREACQQQQDHDAEVAELQATLESTGEGILVTDPAGCIRGYNRRFAQVWAVPDEVLQQRDGVAVLDWMRRRTGDPGAFGHRVAAIVASDEATDEQCFLLASGQLVEFRTQPQLRQGRVIGRVWAFRECREPQAARRRPEQPSSDDALTGLVDRHRLLRALDESIGRARRTGGTLALLVLDLDRFKQINDSLGQHFGDQVLLIAAERLRAAAHQGDVVARVGDDRFALLMHKADHRCAESVARRVLSAISQPSTLGGLQFTLTCSVGAALYPPDGSAAEQLLRRAESAMLRAKLGGRACFRFHQPRHDADLRQRMQLDQAMRQALACRRFRLKYQPQVDLRSGAVIGAEALIRWRDPELGDVPPADFIPVAEDTGFVCAIGEWVLTQAVRQAATWRRQGTAMPVTVNVSAHQLRQADFSERVAALLRHHDLPGALLELDLSESILAHDGEELPHRVRDLAGLGVRFAIDDFGTGSASLADLKRFPVHRLKIDHRFVARVPGDEGDAMIVRAAIQLARAFGLQVLAEGVEDEAQRSFLQQLGCDAYQGLLFAPALDAMSFAERFRGPAAAPGRGLRPVPRP